LIMHHCNLDQEQDDSTDESPAHESSLPLGNPFHRATATLPHVVKRPRYRGKGTRFLASNAILLDYRRLNMVGKIILMEITSW